MYHKISINILKKHKTRTLLSVFSIALSVVLVQAIRIGSDTINNYMRIKTESVLPQNEILILPYEIPSYTNIDDLVQLGDNIPITDPITADTYDKIIQNIQPSQIEAYITLPRVDIILDGKGFFKEVTAVSIKTLDNNHTLNDNEILVSEELYKAIRQVDQSPTIEVKLQISRSEFINKQQQYKKIARTFRIKGTIPYEYQTTAEIITSPDTALYFQKQFGGFKSQEEYMNQIGYSLIKVIMPSEQAYITKVILSEKLNLNILTADSVSLYIQSVIDTIATLLLFFTIIVVVIAGFNIANTISINIIEQIRTIGILKAIGATNKQIFIIYLQQPLIIGIMAGFVSFVILYIIQLVFVKFITYRNITDTVIFVFNLEDLLQTVLLAIIIAVMSGIIPIIKASKANIVRSLVK